MDNQKYWRLRQASYLFLLAYTLIDLFLTTHSLVEKIRLAKQTAKKS